MLSYYKYKGKEYFMHWLVLYALSSLNIVFFIIGCLLLSACMAVAEGGKKPVLLLWLSVAMLVCFFLAII